MNSVKGMVRLTETLILKAGKAHQTRGTTNIKGNCKRLNVV